jgi:hypothetical protein
VRRPRQERRCCYRPNRIPSSAIHRERKIVEAGRNLPADQVLLQRHVKHIDRIERMSDAARLVRGGETRQHWAELGGWKLVQRIERILQRRVG